MRVGAGGGRGGGETTGHEHHGDYTNEGGDRVRQWIPPAGSSGVATATDGPTTWIVEIEAPCETLVEC